MRKTSPIVQTDPMLTRRELLYAAGGVTFLALVPAAGGFAAQQRGTAGADKALPVFTALPYLQPGPGSELIEGQESIVVAWQTNGTPAEYTLEYGATTARDQLAEITHRSRTSGPGGEGEARLNYAARLTGLQLEKRYQYRVRMNGQTVLEGYFTTRKKRGAKARFVAFGDNSYGDMSDRAIAYQAYRARPDFVMNAGDNVYNSGLDNEYARYFFPVYNADQAGPHTGGPLLRSVPFYTVIANHDVSGHDANGHPAADFERNPDSLAYYTNMYMPDNGPTPSYKTTIVGPDARLRTFTDCAGDRFPNMANYSYDYGDAHFLCLDSNVYIDPTDPALQQWISQDLAGTDAPWKFVVYHHPAFNVGGEHYAEQHMRVLSPLLEKHGVDFILNGHEHVYQRARPFRFAPTDESLAKQVGVSHRHVPGSFTIDRRFDGETVTKPSGIIHITTGAGGKHLYDPGSNNTPSAWLYAEDNNADYVARFISDRHSLTVFDMDHASIHMTQIDEWGNTIDRIHVTKS